MLPKSRYVLNPTLIVSVRNLLAIFLLSDKVFLRLAITSNHAKNRAVFNKTINLNLKLIPLSLEAAHNLSVAAANRLKLWWQIKKDQNMKKNEKSKYQNLKTSQKNKTIKFKNKIKTHSCTTTEFVGQSVQSVPHKKQKQYLITENTVMIDY